MRSPWWWFEKALDGLFGHRVAQAVGVVLTAVILVSIVRPAPANWLVHSYSTWLSHEFIRSLQPLLHGLPRPKRH